MQSITMRLVLACGLTLVATEVLAQPFPAERFDAPAPQYYRYPPPAYDTDWQFKRLYGRPNGYVPGPGLCAPGLCQDDPYY